MYQLARGIISILPVIAGLYILVNTVRDVGLSMIASGWPTTAATIMKTDTAGFFNFYERDLTIEYKYQLDGKSYTGYRIAFGGGQFTDIFSSDTPRFRYGDIIDIHYNPEQVNESTIETGFRFAYLLILLIGVGLVQVGRTLWRRLK